MLYEHVLVVWACSKCSWACSILLKNFLACSLLYRMFLSMLSLCKILLSIFFPMHNVLEHVLCYSKCSWACSLLYMNNINMLSQVNVLEHILSYAGCSSWACSFLCIKYVLSYANCFWAYCLMKDALENALSNTECSWLCSFLYMQNFLAHLSKNVGFWSICPESGNSLYLTCICINLC